MARLEDNGRSHPVRDEAPVAVNTALAPPAVDTTQTPRRTLWKVLAQERPAAGYRAGCWPGWQGSPEVVSREQLLDGLEVPTQCAVRMTWGERVRSPV